MAFNSFIKLLMAKESAANALPNKKTGTIVRAVAAKLQPVRANEVKRRINYADKLLPCGKKHLIPQQLGIIFY